MKITKRQLDNFNRGKEPSGNKNVNVRDGIANFEQHAILRKIQWHYSGMLRQPLTFKDIKDYIEIFSAEIQQYQIELRRLLSKQSCY